jgi:geranylgeranyl diphosphate synthase type II
MKVNKAMIQEYIAEKSGEINTALEGFLQKADTSETLWKAMRYALFPGGKRIRPLLAIASCETLGGESLEILPAASALELIHTYSLIHDDLPAMDDDDMRRGKPSAHMAFGEATAILAGDALLTLAFEILSVYPEGKQYNERKLKIIEILSSACGMKGLIDGQIMDLHFEGRKTSSSDLETMHFKKTGTLIRVCLQAGATMAKASEEEDQMMSRFGEKIGLAFQITDDLLDAQGKKEIVGKETQKDCKKRKATYPSLYGIEASRHAAEMLVAEAKELLQPLGKKGHILSALSDLVLSRDK